MTFPLRAGIPKGERKIKTYEVIEKPPKTDNSYRLLRIPEAVAAEIERRRILAESNKQQYGEQYFDHDYISCQENGLPHSTAAMNSALSKLCSRNGLPHITVHGLRHPYVKHKLKNLSDYWPDRLSAKDKPARPVFLLSFQVLFMLSQSLNP